MRKWTASAAFALFLATVGCSGSGENSGQTNCTFPVVLENPPGGSVVMLCGDGTIIECPDASCAFGGGSTSAGDPNSGNTIDSGNDSSTTIVNPTPTPRRRGG